MAVLCVLAVFAWQALAVHYNYGGNWTGLYCIGSRFAQAPGLTERLWLFPDAYGYDGQFYHLIAHDPWQKRGFDRFVDNPRMRFRRILLPGLAHLSAGGRDRYVDAVALLSQLDAARFVTDRVRREALRLEAVSRYLTGDLSGALPLFERLAADPASPQGVRDVAADWVDRVRRVAH